MSKLTGVTPLERRNYLITSTDDEQPTELLNKQGVKKANEADEAKNETETHGDQWICSFGSVDCQVVQGAYTIL